ncbi:hypothetical protein [Mycolicibacterium fortuitum]|uniref:hypothetical protein n=1 Tax=Mycobacteriaceae TaxID=1762 RepID=UPI00262C4B5E|nr:hypothetical protein [Mycolicibacterium fortuitum]
MVADGDLEHVHAALQVVAHDGLHRFGGQPTELLTDARFEEEVDPVGEGWTDDLARGTVKVGAERPAQPDYVAGTEHPGSFGRAAVDAIAGQQNRLEGIPVSNTIVTPCLRAIWAASSMTW